MDIKSHTYTCPLCHQIIYLSEHHDCSSYFRTPKKLPVTEQWLYDDPQTDAALIDDTRNDMSIPVFDEYNGGVEKMHYAKMKDIYDDSKNEEA